jgi:hypothetical protein
MIAQFYRTYSIKSLFKLTFLVYAITFLLLLLKGPIFSPDSYSYLHIEISRFPGFVICVRLFKFLFGEHFGYYLVAFHLLFGFATIHFALKTITKLFNLNFWLSLILFGFLISPYFQSVYAANNITSEGICYPFYLILISSSLRFIFLNEKKHLLWITIAFILLTLTRGQFIIDALIIAFIYALKNYKALKTKPVLLSLALLIALPVISSTLDKTYRKLLFGHFVSTPYSYVNAVALPLYISKKDNIELIKDPDTKAVFEFSFKKIDSLNLLSSRVEGDSYYKYMTFHDNFPPICNQNIHNGGIKYFHDKGNTVYESYIKTEQVCKNLMLPLIQANFKTYISLYITSIMYGFTSIPLAIAMVLLALWSFVKCLKNFNLLHGFTLFTTLMVLSNAMIVAVACHSIERYLFYNNFLLALLAVMWIKKLITTEKCT